MPKFTWCYMHCLLWQSFSLFFGSCGCYLFHLFMYFQLLTFIFRFWFTLGLWSYICCVPWYSFLGFFVAVVVILLLRRLLTFIFRFWLTPELCWFEIWIQEIIILSTFLFWFDIIPLGPLQIKFFKKILTKYNSYYFIILRESKRKFHFISKLKDF